MKKYKFNLLKLIVLSLLFVACSKDDIEVSIVPNAGSSFLDIENDGYFVNLAAQAPSEGQSGKWSVYVGNKGSFEDATSPTSKFYGEPGENYQLSWELSVGDTYKADIISVSFKQMTPEIFTYVVDSTYHNRSLYLQAKKAMYGATGKWEVIDGDNFRIENPESELAQFVGDENSEYTVRWTLTYGSKTEYQEFTFITDELQANAGLDNLDVRNSSEDKKFMDLDAFLPAGAIGEWTLLDGEGGKVYESNNQNSLFEGLADTLYVLEWKVNLDDEISRDTLNVRFRGKWGVWLDPKDGQTYKYIEIIGLEWMAENYNYSYDPGYSSLYYGYADRSIMLTGAAVDSEEDKKHYGRLYDWYAADAITPEGWRLPTYDEFLELENHLGGSIYAADKAKLGGSTGLDLNYAGYFERTSGNDVALRNVFGSQGEIGYFWTSDYLENREQTSCYVAGKDSEHLGFALLYAKYHFVSVRYVREVQLN